MLCHALETFAGACKKMQKFFFTSSLLFIFFEFHAAVKFIKSKSDSRLKSLCKVRVIIVRRLKMIGSTAFC